MVQCWRGKTFDRNGGPKRILTTPWHVCKYTFSGRATGGIWFFLSQSQVTEGVHFEF